MPLGVYLSVPFCRTKCSYCNFASDVFSHLLFDRYVDRVCDDIKHAKKTAGAMDVCFDQQVNSIYLGGGTPTVLQSAQLERLFSALSANFDLHSCAEITVECAPGTLTPPMLETFHKCGVNRVSLGVQSFVDQEARAVGRLHQASTVANDLARLRAAGIVNINVDLIAGLPHQTRASWNHSLDQALESSAPHVSVYMLEVDDESRLGRELIAGGVRYHAHFVPDDDSVADFYEEACERLDAAGIRQYEISNFACEGFESRHNLKYWTRQEYLGFGVDAHSMLFREEGENIAAVRFSNPDSLDAFLDSIPPTIAAVDAAAALEEELFLGLRLNRGVALKSLIARFGAHNTLEVSSVVRALLSGGLLHQEEEVIRLTPRGRLLSNEVFERFVGDPTPGSQASESFDIVASVPARAVGR